MIYGNSYSMSTAINNINLKSIIYQSVLENKPMIFSMIPLFLAYWLQDFYFPNILSEFTSDIPKFISTMNLQSVLKLVLPYLGAEMLHYVNNLIVSHHLPKIELTTVKRLTEQTLDSVADTKAPLNTNEFMMNLKKVIDSESIYHLIVSYLIPTALVAIGLSYYFFKSDTRMGFASLFIIAVFILITIYLEFDGVLSCFENENSMNVFYDGIQDRMINTDSIFTSGTKNTEYENINKEEKIVEEKYVNSRIETSETSLKLHIVSLIMAVVINGMAINMYLQGKMVTKTIIAICLMTVMFTQYYNSTISYLKGTIPYIGKFYELEDYFAQFKIIDVQNNKKIKANTNTISFKNVTIKYDNKIVTDKLSFDIKPNTKTGIVGPVGKGKTTILRAIAQLVDYDGVIEIDNQNLKLYDQNSVTAIVGYIPQHPKLFNNDIYYNLNYGSGYSENAIWKFIDKIGLTDFFNSFPKKLQTKVGKEGSKLSGGQKQLIMIVRVLIQNKQIILLDEPTSSLDVNMKKLLIDLLTSIKTKTFVIVSHDTELLAILDNTIEL